MNTTKYLIYPWQFDAVLSTTFNTQLKISSFKKRPGFLHQSINLPWTFFHQRSRKNGLIRAGGILSMTFYEFSFFFSSPFLRFNFLLVYCRCNFKTRSIPTSFCSEKRGARKVLAVYYEWLVTHNSNRCGKSGPKKKVSKIAK